LADILWDVSFPGITAEGRDVAVPARSRQIEAVESLLERFLDAPGGEDATVGDVAKSIIDGIYEMWTRDVDSAPFPLVVGKAFKTPMVAKVYHVAWIGEIWRGGELTTAVWTISSDSDYGTLTPYECPLWRVVTPSTAKAGAPGANRAGWKTGDIVSHSTGTYRYEILATGDKCVLLCRLGSDDVQAESNHCLEKYYKKELFK